MTTLPSTRTHEPFSNQTTSLAAAKAIQDSVGGMKRRVLEIIMNAGAHGATDFEIEALTGQPHQCASARRRALVVSGLVVDSGRQRNNSRGKASIAWVLAPDARPLEPGQRSLSLEYVPRLTPAVLQAIVGALSRPPEVPLGIDDPMFAATADALAWAKLQLRRRGVKASR